jgi:hypothetical protein
MRTELIRRIMRRFLPSSTTPLPPLPICRVFFNARQLASILGDPELTPKHFAAAVELDGSLMPKRRLPRRQPMSAEAKATWARAVTAAGDVTRVSVQDLRAALSFN